MAVFVIGDFWEVLIDELVKAFCELADINIKLYF